MGRKDLLASVTSKSTEMETELKAEKQTSRAASRFSSHGASRSMRLSIEEMAENTRRMSEGENIISLNPDLLDGSFVSDRIDINDDNYAELKNAIQEHGQSTPILVRPHPETDGRYMIVFGHRRAMVAKDLGISVLAVVKKMEDITHIIAQGQENTARANLTFIEKALFARKLLDMGQDKATIKTALTIDDTLLSRMLSIAEIIPDHILEALGSAKGVGRDRWEDLKKAIAHPDNKEKASALIGTSEFEALPSPKRVGFLLDQLKQKKRVVASKPAQSSKVWNSQDKAVSATFKTKGKQFQLAVKSEHAAAFGDFISTQFEELYSQFKKTQE